MPEPDHDSHQPPPSRLDWKRHLIDSGAVLIIFVGWTALLVIQQIFNIVPLPAGITRALPVVIFNSVGLVVGILLLMVLRVVLVLINRRRDAAQERSRELPSMRCRRCGYALKGLHQPRCPECGALRGFTKSAEELGIDREIEATHHAPASDADHDPAPPS